MDAIRRNRGPWTHRVLIGVFTVFLVLLAYWLLGFVMKDIGALPGPSYPDVEKRRLDQDLVKQNEEMGRQIAEMDLTISNHRRRESILRESTASSQQTMNQLLEFQRLNLQKDIKPSPQEQQALAESQNTFLANQKQRQALNEKIEQLNDEQTALKARKAAIEATLQNQRGPAREEFQRLLNQHNIKIASLQLAVLIPLLLLALFFFLRKHGGIYGPIVYACGMALIVRVGLVIHEHFPSRYFKYILVVISIAVVLRILVYLLRMIAYPKKDWLLKQYREAYERFFCPVCGYPIRKGPLKYLFWTRRTIKKLALPEALAGPQKDEAYSCPSCGTKVFEECSSCHGIRPSLLPYCDKCGAVKEIA